MRCFRPKTIASAISSPDVGRKAFAALVAVTQAVYTLAFQKWHWQCTQCAPGGNTGYRFSHLTGTIFENTNKPLRDWYKVVHLMLVSKKGMSALQIYRYMGFGSYKTAWLMCHKVRVALIEDIEKLGGIVEVDETYVGGSNKTGSLPVIPYIPLFRRHSWAR